LQTIFSVGKPLGMKKSDPHRLPAMVPEPPQTERIGSSRKPSRGSELPTTAGTDAKALLGTSPEKDSIFPGLHSPGGMPRPEYPTPPKSARMHVEYGNWRIQRTPEHGLSPTPPPDPRATTTGSDDYRWAVVKAADETRRKDFLMSNRSVLQNLTESREAALARTARDKDDTWAAREKLFQDQEALRLSELQLLKEKQMLEDVKTKQLSRYENLMREVEQKQQAVERTAHEERIQAEKLAAERERLRDDRAMVKDMQQAIEGRNEDSEKTLRKLKAEREEWNRHVAETSSRLKTEADTLEQRRQALREDAEKQDEGGAGDACCDASPAPAGHGAGRADEARP